MATGYNILLPNGTTEIVKASTDEQRIRICEKLLDKWNGYCRDNWLSVNSQSPYCPENKVKMFLSSLGYFLIGSGSGTNGIVTRYKDIMNGKRQIPVSSCPSYIEDSVYGLIHTGGQGTQFAKDQEESFNNYVSFLDEKAERSYKKRVPKKKTRTEQRSDRIIRMYREGVNRVDKLSVDTDGKFSFSGIRYQIDLVHCKQYAPKKVTDEEDLYDMDLIVRVVMMDGAVQFYDQDFKRIEDRFITQCE